MRNVWRGVSEEHIGRFLAAAGRRATSVRALPPDPAARGPSLFVASARRPGARS